MYKRQLQNPPEADSPSYQLGDTAIVTAFTDPAFTFANWTENGVVVSTASNYSFTVNGSRTLVANYLSNTGVTVNTNAATADGGTTSGDGAYAVGASAAVSAVPKSGYGFVNWTESGFIVSTTAAYQFTANASHALVAHFAPAVAIDVSESPLPAGGVTGGGSYGVGAVATLTAAPTAGYAFTGWSEGGKVVSASSTYSFTVTAARAVVANFAPTFNITAGVAVSGGGSISGAGSFVNGVAVALLAAPNAGYQFVNWVENGAVVSASSSYTFSASTNRALMANFALIIPTLDTSASTPVQFTFQWPANLPGWTLEESPDLSPGSWVPSLLPITVNGSNNQVVFPAPTGCRFFHLVHP